MTPKEKYNELLQGVAGKDSFDKRIKEIKAILKGYSDVLSDDQISLLKSNVTRIKHQKVKAIKEEKKFENTVNRFIDDRKKEMTKARYIQFLSDMYTAYHTYGTTLAEFHIAMRCFNEQAEIMEEEK